MTTLGETNNNSNGSTSIAVSNDARLEPPQIKHYFPTYISETQTMESCSSWSTNVTNGTINASSLDTTTSTIASSSQDTTTNSLLLSKTATTTTTTPTTTPTTATTTSKASKKKNPLNLTIQTTTTATTNPHNGVETSSICNSLDSPPLSTPASFASSPPSVICDNVATAATTTATNIATTITTTTTPLMQREKILLGQCWDRILVRQFDETSTTTNQTATSTSPLYGRDNVHTRLHQLVVVSGPTQSGKTLLCQSLSSSSGSADGDSNRIYLYGGPSCTTATSTSSQSYYHHFNNSSMSMEPLKVFSNMMQQLAEHFGSAGSSGGCDELQLQASTSFGSSTIATVADDEPTSNTTTSKSHNHYHYHEPLLALALEEQSNQFTPKEQTILIRTFPSLQAFFPNATPKATFAPTPDTWTRKSPTVAGSYQYQFQSAMKAFLDIVASTMPLIMVVDDLQCLDPASMGLLDFLLAATPSNGRGSNSSNSILFVLCFTTLPPPLPPSSTQQEQKQQQQQQQQNYYWLHNNRHSTESSLLSSSSSTTATAIMPQKKKNDLLATLSYCREMGIKRLPHYDFELTEIDMLSSLSSSSSSSPQNLLSLTPTSSSSSSSIPSPVLPSSPPTTTTTTTTKKMNDHQSPHLLLLATLSPVDLQVAKLAACLGMDPIPLDLLEIVYDALLANQGLAPKRSKMAPNAHLLFDHLARLIGQGILEWKPMKMTMVWANSQLIRAALYLVTQEVDQEEWFRVIATGLVDALSEQQKEYWIYLIADLHNVAGVIPEKEIKTANVAKLNQQAALRAIQSGSLLAAGHYLCQAIRALKQAAATKKHHHQTLEQSLYRLWMQVSAYTNNDVGLRVASSHLLVEDKQGFLEKLMIHQTQFSGLLSSCSINPNATHIAQQGANRCFQLLASDLAMKFPTKDLVQGVTVTKGLMKLKSQSKSKASVKPNSRALMKVPVMDKPIQLAAMKLLETCANFCYLAGDVRFPLVVLKSVELFQKYGLSIYAPMVHALVGVLMVVALDDSKAGIAYANYSMTLWTRTFEASAVQKALEAQTICLSHFVVLPWAHRFSDLLAPLRRAYELAMQGGDIDIAAQAISNYAVLAFLSGRELSILNKELCYYVNQLRRYNRVKGEATCQIWWYVVRKLLPVDRSLPVAPGGMNEEEIMTYVLQTKDEDVLCNFHSAKAMLYTLQGNHQKAADNAVDNSDHTFKTLKGHPLLMVLPFYMGISLCEVAQKSENENYKKHAKKMLSITKEYNKKGNPNAAHHLMALEAEIQLVNEGRQHLAIARKKFKEAILNVSEAELFQDAALLHQRLGTFYKEHMDNMEASKQHILQSSTFVRQWGAKESVRP